MTKHLLDAKGRPVVVVTGMGLVTSLGCGKTENWRALVEGRSGIKTITRFPTDGLRTTIAGTVDGLLQQDYSAFDLSLEMANAAGDEAVRQAAIGAPGSFPGPLFIATPPSELEWPALTLIYSTRPEPYGGAYPAMLASARKGRHRELAAHAAFAALADQVQNRFGTKGEPISLCTACASGATALQMGAEAIRRGEVDATLVIGTDATVHPEGLIRFSLLSALSTRNERPQAASRPFARSRDGFVVAEGAAAIVLESYANARARGAEILGVVAGAGEQADNYHRTRSKPDGAAMIGAIRRALFDAEVTHDAIDHVNAHGTSTPENDRMEHLALAAVFGERLADVPVTANKSMIGHTLIAAGAVEAVIALMSITEEMVPPTINADDPDPELSLDVVANVARRHRMRSVLSNSFGFGGQNVCLVFSAEPN